MKRGGCSIAFDGVKIRPNEVGSGRDSNRIGAEIGLCGSAVAIPF